MPGSVSYLDGSMSFENFPKSISAHKLSSARLWIENYNNIIIKIYIHCIQNIYTKYMYIVHCNSR